MKLVFILCVLIIAGCDQQSSDKALKSASIIAEKKSSEPLITSRWYTQSQLDLGEKTYQIYCLQCHNKNAEGIKDWKKTLADGNYPPPPLNGTAHAWHHDIGTLTRTIKNGGIPLGGVMPGFSQKLSDAEISAVIAYFQSFWSDDIYQSWLDIGGLK